MKSSGTSSVEELISGRQYVKGEVPPVSRVDSPRANLHYKKRHSPAPVVEEQVKERVCKSGEKSE